MHAPKPRATMTAHNYQDCDIATMVGMTFDELFSENHSTTNKAAAKYELLRDNSPDEVAAEFTPLLISGRHRERRAVGSTPAAAPVSPCSSDGSSIASDGVSGRFGNIDCKYRVEPRVLGIGYHGSVRQCVHRATGRPCAVKTIRKGGPEGMPEVLARETVLLRQMNHRSIVRLVDVFEDADCVHLVTDLCEGGELFERIKERSSPNGGGGARCFAENEAARILQQVLVAIAYMHERDIVHRDIKPENILFQTAEKDSPIKIIDFGLARKHSEKRGDPPMTTVVGTPYYIAPEVLQGWYGRSCDLWSVGVIAYTLLCGYPPFNGSDSKAVQDAVRLGIYRFPSEDWKGTSREARDFIRRLLERDTKRRMLAKQALKHPWIVKHVDDAASKENHQHEPSVEVVFRGASRRDSIICGNVGRLRNAFV